MNEANVLATVRHALSRISTTMFRNNIGLAYTGPKKDTPVKYGVCNPGGADLIGITPVTVTPDMVGHTVGVFTAIECKRSDGGIVSPEQKNFIRVIVENGGIAGVARSAEEAVAIITGYKIGTT